MTHGFDTSFLIAAEVADHENHQSAQNRLDQLWKGGDDFALAPQVLAEFVHVVSDARRFPQPLTVSMALDRAQLWWNHKEIRRVMPTHGAIDQFLSLMRKHHLGRRQILDTLLAATYMSAGVVSVLSSNVRDFRRYEGMTVIEP